MSRQALDAERAHLAGLLEAIKRCVYFPNASSRQSWPLGRDQLAQRRKDVDLFESLAAMNERFAKLQTLIPGLYANAARFIRYAGEARGILPLHGDFAEEFTAIAGDLDLLIQNP